MSVWRRVFILILICATYCWFTVGSEAWIHVTERDTYKDLDVGEKHVLVAADLVHQMTKNDMSRAMIAETLFINCFFFLALTLMYYKRGGSTGYIAGAFFTNSCIGLGLCNFLYPIAPLQPSVKKSGDKDVKMPHVGHYLYTALAILTVLVVRLRWNPQFCVFGLVGYIALPLVLVVLFPVGNSNSISSMKCQLCIIPWVVIGGYIALYTRSNRCFPVYDLQGKLFDSGILIILKGRFFPNNINALPPVYIAFAAQLLSICLCSLLFSLLDTHGRVSYFVRLCLAPFFFLAPTVAIPLYFMLRTYNDVEMVSLEKPKKLTPKSKKPAPQKKVGAK